MNAVDEDLASVESGIGWSQATRRVGHCIGRLRPLDVAHAAVGVRLLRTHRRQLSADMRVTQSLA